MARLMRYMINYQGRKLFSTLSIKLAKPIVYSLAPPVPEAVFTDGVCWECGLSITNKNTFPSGTVYRYTLDGSRPDINSAILTDSTVIDRNCTVRIVAIYEGEDVIRMSASAGELIIDTLRNGIPSFTIGKVKDILIRII